jgi:HEAT repeat protein
MSNEFEKFIESNREAFETRTPDPAVLERIHAQMRASKKKQGILIPMKAVRWAIAASVILVAGVGGFWMLQKQQPAATTTVVANNNNEPLTKPSTSPTEQPVTNDIENKKETAVKYPAVRVHQERPDRVEAELAANRQVLFAKLNDMESPGQRITGATLANKLKNTDKEIVDVLVRTMNTDPNTNVRLAALDALSKFHRESYVKKQLVASLEKQKDPMVQIELIQLLTRMRETSILKELDKIIEDGNTLKAVKDNAYSSIFTLRS